MNCPKCQNRGFEPTADVKRPLVNLGGKQHYDNFDLRRYACLQCGAAFITKEVYFRDVEVKKSQMELQLEVKMKNEK